MLIFNKLHAVIYRLFTFALLLILLQPMNLQLPPFFSNLLPPNGGQWAKSEGY